MPTQLEQAVVHIKAGEIEKGKQLLIEILKQNPRDENGWLWMTKCVTDAEKRYCFDKVLQINPQNQHAIEGLRRLNNPVSPNAQPKVIQPPVSQDKSKKINPLLILAVVGLLGFAGVCTIAVLVFRTQISPSNSNQPNTPVPTQIARPDYQQMLESGGFTYFISDNEGNPSYSSPCNAIAIVKPDSVGFAVNHSSDNDCATAEIGRIVSAMYPSEVFDCVITTMNLLDEFDKMLIRTAVGYEVSVVIIEDEHTLLIIIKDPR